MPQAPRALDSQATPPNSLLIAGPRPRRSLLRGVPLAEYRDDTSHPDIRAAVDELNKLVELHGPKEGGCVTPQTLFRGNAWYVDRSDPSGRSGRWVTLPGVTQGPVVSQFLLRDAPYSSQFLPPGATSASTLIEQKVPRGYTAVTPYLRITPQPARECAA